MNPLVQINHEIMVTLLELLKQGGPLALWALAIYLTINLVKLIMVCLVVYLAIKTIAMAITNCYKIKLQTKATSVSVFTTQVSQHLMDCLADYHKSVTAILKDIDEHLKNSKEKSKKETV